MGLDLVGSSLDLGQRSASLIMEWGGYAYIFVIWVATNLRIVEFPHAGRLVSRSFLCGLLHKRLVEFWRYILVDIEFTVIKYHSKELLLRVIANAIDLG